MTQTSCAVGMRNAILRNHLPQSKFWQAHRRLTLRPTDTLRLRWQEKQKYQTTLKFSPKVSKRLYLHEKQNRSKVSSFTNLQQN